MGDSASVEAARPLASPAWGAASSLRAGGPRSPAAAPRPWPHQRPYGRLPVDGCSASCSSPISDPFSGGGRGVPRRLLASGLSSPGSLAPAAFFAQLSLRRAPPPSSPRGWTGGGLHVAAALPEGAPDDPFNPLSNGGLMGVVAEEGEWGAVWDTLPLDASTAAPKAGKLLFEYGPKMVLEQDPAIKQRALDLYEEAVRGLLPKNGGRLHHHCLSDDLIKKCATAVGEAVREHEWQLPFKCAFLSGDIATECLQYARSSQRLEVACSDLAAALASSTWAYTSPPLASAGRRWAVKVVKQSEDRDARAGIFLLQLADSESDGEDSDTWSQDFEFRLVLIDRASPSRSLLRYSKACRFGLDQVEWGWPDIASLAEVTDPASTFAVDGKLCIEFSVWPVTDCSAATLFPGLKPPAAAASEASPEPQKAADFTAAATALSQRMQRDYLDSVETRVGDAVRAQLQRRDAVECAGFPVSVCAVLPVFSSAGAGPPPDSTVVQREDPTGSTKIQGGGKGLSGRVAAKANRASQGFGKPRAPPKSLSAAKGGASRADLTPSVLSNVTPLELGVIAGCLAAVKAARSAWKVGCAPQTARENTARFPLFCV